MGRVFLCWKSLIAKHTFVTYTCDCGYIVFHIHSYTQTVLAPTYDEKGFSTYTCSCGDTYIDDQVNAIGHNYGVWTSNGNNTHSKVCKNDNTHVITKNCNGGESNYTQKAFVLIEILNIVNLKRQN